MPPKAEAQRRERQDPTVALKELLEQKDLSDEETLDQLRVLIDEGANVDVPFHENCPLAQFIHQGKILCVNEVIAQKVAVEASTSAISVCLKSHLSQKTMSKIIQSLMIAGADINNGETTELEPNITPLFFACQNGLNLVVKELLRYKPKPDLELGNLHFASCLVVAVANNDVEITEMLIKAGAKLEVTSSDNEYSEMTPLLIAAQNGNADMVNLLLGAGANITATTKDGWNALHFAARHGNLSVCKVLIEKAKGLILCTAAQCYPCDIAMRYGHGDVVEFLLKIDQYAFNNYIEVLFQQSFEMIQTVIENCGGYTIDTRDLRAALRFADKEVLEYLTKLPNDKFNVTNDSLKEFIAIAKDLETKALLQKIFNKINDITEIKKEEEN